MPIKQLAKAKINLCLHVTGQQTDGYHLLDSIVAFADFGDVLHFEANETLELHINGPFGGGLDTSDDNLILRAARALNGDKTATINLKKNLPIASGIGGGSADAAATLRGLSTLWGISVDDQLALKLGADVPVCMKSTTQRMQGIGGNLGEFTCLPPLPAVLVNPRKAVATPTVFSALNVKENDEIQCLPNENLTLENAIKWLKNQRNDLQEPAMKVAPVIGAVLDALESTGADLARMSGSGATCFGLFKSSQDADLAAQKLAMAHPDWWVQSVTLG